MINDDLVAERIRSIRDRIESHGRRGVRLIAVTKGFGVEAMVAAARAGCVDVGENYAQELIAKLADYPVEVERPTIHFIGRLQSNKVRSVSSLVDCWHTVDRATCAIGPGPDSGQCHRRGRQGWVPTGGCGGSRDSGGGRRFAADRSHDGGSDRR